MNTLQRQISIILSSKQIYNPFPGLRPYQANESHLFFGRQNHVNEIMEILQTGKFVSVVGNSGSGKSSLIRAGVLPKLEQEGNWLVVTMRPGSNPMESLAHALHKFSDELGLDSVSQTQETLLRHNRALLQICRPIDATGKRLMILVDQFEELFRYNQNDGVMNEAQHFADLLVQSIQQHDLPIFIMLSLRSDFLGDCEQFEGLPQAINKGLFLIPRLNSEELKDVIVGPVTFAGAKISPVLVQNLITEVGNNPDQLPVLQHALMRTWEAWAAKNASSSPIDSDSYEQTGGLAMALSRHAEEAFAELKTDEERKLAELIFKTITYKGADKRGVRRPTSLKRVVAITQAKIENITAVLDVFRSQNRGFIMPPFNVGLTENSIIDISHESLMRVWERLKVWSDEEAEAAELYLLLSNSASLYEENKAGLWHDPDLQRALDWKEKNQPNVQWADQYNQDFKKSMRFLEASELHRKHLRKIANRSRRLIVASMIFAIAILSVLSIWAFSERQNSVKSAAIAKREQVRAQSQFEIAENQKQMAEANLLKANEQEQKALREQAEAEKQKNFAILKAEETRLQKLKAERATLEAIDSKRAAILDRQIAESQRLISDSLRVKAERSEKNATRLRVLGIAQNMAINSKLRAAGDSADQIAVLMAAQAFKFNKKYGGESNDQNIYDGLLAVLSKNKSLWDSHVLKMHTDAVKSVAYANSNSKLVSSADDGKIIVYDLNNPANPTMIGTSGLIFNNLCFSPDFSRFIYSGDDNFIYITDLSKKSPSAEKININHGNKITSLHWSKTGIYSTCLDNKVRWIDPAKSQVIGTVECPTRPISSSLNESRNQLMIGGENGSIYVTDLNFSKSLQLYLSLASGQITSLDFGTTNKFLAFGTNQGLCGIVRLDNPDQGVIKLNAHSAGVTEVKFQPGDAQLASSSLDGKVILWNILKTENSPIVLNNHSSWVLGISYSPNGKNLATSGKDKTIIIQDTEAQGLYDEVQKALLRNFTKAEWDKYIGADIPYEFTKE